jgi:hypothetical protein
MLYNGMQKVLSKRLLRWLLKFSTLLVPASFAIVALAFVLYPRLERPDGLVAFIRNHNASSTNEPEGTCMPGLLVTRPLLCQAASRAALAEGHLSPYVAIPSAGCLQYPSSK